MRGDALLESWRAGVRLRRVGTLPRLGRLHSPDADQGPRCGTHGQGTPCRTSMLRHASRQVPNCGEARRLDRARIARTHPDRLLFASTASLNNGCANWVRLTTASSGKAGAFPCDVHSCLVIAMTAAAVCPTSVGRAIHAWPAAENPISPSVMIISS